MNRIILSLMATTLAAPLAAVAQTTIFSDDFSNGSTINGTSTPGGTPTASSTSYDIASSKNSLSSVSINPNHLVVAVPATTSGFTEAQAVFTSTPVALGAVGDYVNMTFTFTDTANILSGSATAGSSLFFGLYNSGGSAPLTGLANSGLSATAGSPNSTGGVQSWQGLVGRIQVVGQNSSIYTRPAQSGVDTSSQNQDLVGNNLGGGAFDTPTGTTLNSLASTAALTDSQQYTLSYTLTLSAANTLDINYVLYNGVGTGGTTNFSQSATATGANFVGSFDGLAIGERFSGASAASSMDINSIGITALTAPVVPEPATLALAGIGALGMVFVRRWRR